MSSVKVHGKHLCTRNDDRFKENKAEGYFEIIFLVQHFMNGNPNQSTSKKSPHEYKYKQTDK